VEGGPAPTDQPGAEDNLLPGRHRKRFWKSEYERGESSVPNFQNPLYHYKLVADDEQPREAMDYMSYRSVPLLVRKCSAHQLATTHKHL
jgi:hypothetical protein